MRVLLPGLWHKGPNVYTRGPLQRTGGIQGRRLTVRPSAAVRMKELKFGPWKINSSEVFLSSESSFAFVNLKPVVDGHVLVTSKRVAPRFADLSPEEAADLWLLAHRLGPKLQQHLAAAALTYVIQDGPDAGQTVPHVHIHIMPRRPGDFEKNDDLYTEMDNNDHATRRVDAAEERKPRTAEEMAAEAEVLRALFENSA